MAYWVAVSTDLLGDSACASTKHQIAIKGGAKVIVTMIVPETPVQNAVVTNAVIAKVE